jgi:plasmid stabilization system protein ParE
MWVRYTLQAQRDLDSIYTYLDQRAPAAAQSVKSLIERRSPASRIFHSWHPKPANPESSS